MINVPVHKHKGNGKVLPAFHDIAQRFDRVRHRAFELFQKRDESDQVLDDWLRAEREIFGFAGAELTETASAYELKVALPGFEARDVEITATPVEIIIHATAHHEESGKDTVVWTEWMSNDVYRQIRLPVAVNPDKTVATLEKGLLHITAPKAVQAEVKSAAQKAA